MDGFAALLGFANIFSGVESRSFGGGDETLSAVPAATNGLLRVFGKCFSGRLFCLFGALEEAAFGEDLGAR